MYTNLDRIKRRLIKAFRSMKYGNYRLWDKSVVENLLINNNDAAIKYGDDDPGIIYYYIDMSLYDAGFFAQQIRIMQFLDIAEKNGWNPIVQMSKQMYIKGGNIFDSIYYQPCNRSPKEVCLLRNVIIAEDEHLSRSTIYAGYEGDLCTMLNRLSHLRKKYITYLPDIKHELDKDVNELFSFASGKRIGVHFRGGDYAQEWHNHPLFIGTDSYIEYIDKALNKGYETIFLATDDMRALKRFKEKYGNLLVCYKDVTRVDKDIGIHFEKQGTRLAYEVIRDMYTLSICDGLLAGLSHVPQFAIVEKESRNEVYDYCQIINYGIKND